MTSPNFDLQEAKDLVSRDRVVWTNKPNSLKQVQKRLDLNAERAAQFIKDGITYLSSDNFAREATESATREASRPMDVYGAEYSRKGWYIKFFLESASFKLCSFHAPAHPLRTLRAGTINP